MTDVDSAAAIAFVTLLLEPAPHNRGHDQARDELLSGDLEPLVWGLASLLVGCMDTLAPLLSVTTAEILQSVAPRITSPEEFPLD